MFQHNKAYDNSSSSSSSIYNINNVENNTNPPHENIPCLKNNLIGCYDDKLLYKSLFENFPIITIDFPMLTNFSSFLKVENEIFDEIFIKYPTNFYCVKIFGDEFCKHKITIKNFFGSIIEKNIRIKEINLNEFLFCKIEDKERKYIFEFLDLFIKTNIFLEKISFSRFGLENEDIDKLSGFFKNNKNIKCIDFSRNKKLDDGCIDYLNSILKSENIENILINFTSIKNTVFLNEIIKMEIKKSFEKELDFIDLEGLYLTDMNILYIKNNIENDFFDNVLNINLGSNNINSNGIKYLSEKLISNTKNKINIIKLDSNNLNDDSMDALGLFIKNKGTLEYINLSSNQITNKGINILSKHIIGECCLKSLSFSANKNISNDSVIFFEDMIKQSSINDLSINHTSISEEYSNFLDKLTNIPFEEREIPIITVENVKSASKRMKE